MSVYTAQDAYIIATGSFLPGKPIGNDEIESVLGLVNGKKSRYKRRILQSNGIKSRHYALDENGHMTHLTEEMASNAIQNALSHAQCCANDLDLVAVGTTLPDLLAPGIASMVHGRVGGKNADILSTGGICGAGSAALKSAALSVISGQHNTVVACGTDRPSLVMRGHRFEEESDVCHDQDVAESYKYFHADFLRWMLSDGAGAFIIGNAPKDKGLSLKVEWIETASYAHELETCMYMGTSNPNALTPDNTWVENIGKQDVSVQSMLLLRQDVKVLSKNIVEIVVDYAVYLRDKYGLPDIDWFLPHLSSYFFKEELQQKFGERGIDLPDECWFTNLAEKGNTGAASIFIMLDELFKSGRVKDGQKILVMNPESGRFSVSYGLFTAEYRC